MPARGIWRDETENADTQRFDFGDGLTAVVTPCRLEIVLEPAALLRVLDRLVVLDLLPNVRCLRRPETGDAVVRLEWADIGMANAVNLRDRLAQIPAVRTVCLVEPVGGSGSPPDQPIAASPPLAVGVALAAAPP